MAAASVVVTPWMSVTAAVALLLMTHGRWACFNGRVAAAHSPTEVV